MATNATFILSGPLSTSFIEFPMPNLNDDEVLIEVKETGICGSDIHFYVDGKLGDRVITEPIGLGHESSGVIADVGSKVPRTRIGERVAIEPWSVCRVCDYCKRGLYQLCGRCSVFDSPRRGTLAQYFKIPSDMAFKLPDNLSFEEGALMEPLAVAVHAVHSIGGLRPGQHVAVFGCGAIGLLCIAVANALGAARTIAIDNNAERLAFCTKYSSTKTFMPPVSLPAEDKSAFSARSATLFRRAFDMEKENSGVDLVIEATGAESCIQMAFFVAKAGGRIAQVGIGATESQIPIDLLTKKQLVVRGSSRYGPGDYPLAIALATSGKVDLKRLITHRFNFVDARAAFEITRAGVDSKRKHVLKTMISGTTRDTSDSDLLLTNTLRSS